jgi:hypothetical protein
MEGVRARFSTIPLASGPYLVRGTEKGTFYFSLASQGTGGKVECRLLRGGGAQGLALGLGLGGFFR